MPVAYSTESQNMSTTVILPMNLMSSTENFKFSSRSSFSFFAKLGVLGA